MELKDCASIKTGKNTIESHFTPNPSQLDIWFITPENIGDGFIITLRLNKYIYHRTISKYYNFRKEDYIQENDYLLYIKGSEVKFVCYNLTEKAIASKDFIVIRPEHLFLIQFLKEETGRNYFTREINRIIEVETDKTLIINKICNILIPTTITLEQFKQANTTIASQTGFFDPRDIKKIQIHKIPKSLDSVIQRITRGSINLNTHFQRKTGLWKEGVKSRLIESIIMRLPIPAFYFDCVDEEEWLVIDGLQRLSAIREFVIEKKLVLRELDYLPDLEGKTFDELSEHEKTNIREYDIISYQIMPGTPTQMRYKIYRSINTSSLVLTKQEIRHAINSLEIKERDNFSPSKYIEQLANDPNFIDSLKFTEYEKSRMTDRELVLRFIAFRMTNYRNYHPKMVDFLDNAMSALYSEPEEKFEFYKSIFGQTFLTCKQIGLDELFLKKIQTTKKDENDDDDNDKIRVINPLFEIWTSAIADLTILERQNIVTKKQQLLKEYKLLLNEVQFKNAIDSKNAYNITELKYRFASIEKLVKNILHNDKHITTKKL